MNNYLTDKITELLTLCAVDSKTSVCVLFNNECIGTKRYYDLVLKSLEKIGAKFICLHFPSSLFNESPYGKHVRIDEESVEDFKGIEEARKADIVIDLVGLLHTPIQMAILEAGPRMLSLAEHPDVLRRLFPRKEIRERAEKIAATIKRAKEVEVISSAGTNLRMEIAGPVLPQYGYTDQSGRWDTCPAALVNFYPKQDSVEGQVVLDVGDFIADYSRFVESRVTFKIKEGIVKEIEGNGLDAVFVKEYLKNWNDPNVYFVSHESVGIDERAVWLAPLLYKEPLIGQDMRSFFGAYIFSLGPNRFIRRFAKCHLDTVLRNCVVKVDGETIPFK